MVLDSLVDDHETIDTMRDCGETAPHGLALVDEADLITAVAALLDEGLVEAWEGRPMGSSWSPTRIRGECRFVHAGACMRRHDRFDRRRVSCVTRKAGAGDSRLPGRAFGNVP